MLAALGVIVALHSLVGIGAFLVAVVPAYLYRIGVEERAMQAVLGPSYDEYRSRRWKLLPHVY